MAGAGDKSEKPTAKKLKDARKKGQATMRSPEVAGWTCLLVGTYMLPMTWDRAHTLGLQLLAHVPSVAADPDPSRATALLGEGLLGVLSATWPLMAVCMATGLTLNVAQGGVRVAVASLKPQWKRLNPMTGLKKMFGAQGLWETGKALTRVTLFSFVAWQAGSTLLDDVTVGGQRPLMEVIDQTGTSLVSLFRTIAVVGLAVALLDVLMTRRRVGKGLKMSKQEVKEEHKQTEGDPHTKGMIRSRMMQMGRNRMISRVAEADVVLANPTHVAVALVYKPGNGAPRVVAKGAGPVAAKIREAAAEGRVPIVVDIPLARAIHKSCEVDQEIPAVLFTAVATVLAFVMGLRRRGVHAGTHRVPGGSQPFEDPGFAARRRRRVIR